MELTIAFASPLIVLAVCILLCFLQSRRAVARTGMVKSSLQIIDVTSSNNTSPPMDEVLSDLDHGLEEFGMMLNVNMRGYTDTETF